ncbi:MAG: STELLO glycosyltransferase family protein [Alphaproteobacteria bacterium]
MRTAIVVTSIHAPNASMSALATGAQGAGYEMLMIGDATSPRDFALPGCRFVGLDEQRQSDLRFALQCPERHYARKNIGYLMAAAAGAELIVETDDDNAPLPTFFAARERRAERSVAALPGWLNVYRYFTETLIWPRGLPLDTIHRALPPRSALPRRTLDCPIQQGMADDDPDVDAIFRLLVKATTRFAAADPVALDAGTWCPFNSQNTAWWRDAFALLYLPAYCSFRLTDIWRSFVAQRIAWENDWHVLFHGPTVRQARNEHDLMRDFADEVPGYLNNERIRRTLEDLPLARGAGAMADNLRRCYGAMVTLGLIGAAEMPLLDLWLADLESAGAPHG